ncbi:hypothetical protein QIW31_07655 [Francisellaceae bacterium CB299]
MSELGYELHNFETNCIKIHKCRYIRIINAEQILRECLSKEKIYDIVLLNYYEFEKELYEIILKHNVIDSIYDITENFNDYKILIEQKILNLLSSVTLYLDSFKGDINDKFHNSFKGLYQEIENQ